MTVFNLFILLALICFVLDSFLPTPPNPPRLWPLGWAFVMAALITTGVVAIR